MSSGKEKDTREEKGASYRVNQPQSLALTGSWDLFTRDLVEVDIMAQITGVLEENLQKNVLESKVLMVGAGGIGCELLKNLVLTGNTELGEHI